MKTFYQFLFASFFLFAAQTGFAQDKKESIPVKGNCGMCKGKIEKAAKAAGATAASWDAATQLLTVSYSATSTSAAKIQQEVAGTGYDTRDVRATNAAYDKLHGCCKYERSTAKAATDCCTEGAACCKDGKCDKTGNCKKSE